MKKSLFFVLFFLVSSGICWAGASVLGELIQVKTAQKGEKYEGTILVRNSENTPAEVRVYQTDYLFYADGRNIYGEPGSAPRSNAPWISISPVQFFVPPQETVQVHYTVQVPDELKMPGSYWSLIMVESIPETSAESASREKKDREMTLQTMIRYGIQIVTNIDNSGDRKIRFVNTELIGEGEKKVLQLDIENIGERWLAPTVWAEIYNKEGVSLGRFESGRMQLYPGCSVRHRIALPGIGKGSYRVLIVADNGDESVFGAQYDLEME